jgi:hypothetical protein
LAAEGPQLLLLGPGNVETLTISGGSNLFHRVATDWKGNPHVAYQSWRRAHSDI